jgi:hypothetical protein
VNDNLRISCEWTLRDATLTAVADRGRVYNERGLDLLVTEGRHEQIHCLPEHGWDEVDGERREVWDYQLNFYLIDAKDSDNSEQSECLVAIVGTLPDGRQCKIHGTGYVGRDNLEQIEGAFFFPPKIELTGPEDDLVVWDRPPDPADKSARIFQ